NGSRVESRLVYALRRDQAEAAHRLHASGDAEKCAMPVQAEALAGGKHRRHDHRARMDRSALESVVEIFPVRRGAVEQRRVFRTVALGVAQRRARTARIETLFQRGDVVAVARGDAKSAHIHQKVPAFVLYWRWDILQTTNLRGESFRNRECHAMYPPPLTCSDWPVM